MPSSILSLAGTHPIEVRENAEPNRHHQSQAPPPVAAVIRAQSSADTKKEDKN